MRIRFSINGKKVVSDVDPMSRLLDVIREDLGLTGTKEGCGKGECGACSVLIDGDIFASCIYPAAHADGKSIVTIEGLAKGGKLHPIQKAFIEEGAVQCGFCTPGMVLAAKALLDKNPHPSSADIKKALSGNLCRCTGYAKIEKAVGKASAASRGNPPDSQARPPAKQSEATWARALRAGPPASPESASGGRWRAGRKR